MNNDIANSQAKIVGIQPPPDGIQPPFQPGGKRRKTRRSKRSRKTKKRKQKKTKKTRRLRRR